MKRLFRGVYHKCRLYLNYWANLRVHNLFIQNQSGDSQTDEGKIAVFDVEDNRFTRHLFNYVNFFLISGYVIYMKNRVTFTGNLRDYSRFFLETKNLFLVNKLPQDSQVRFSTVPQPGYVHLLDDFLSMKKDEQRCLTYPFSMHPMIYRDNLDSLTEGLRDSEKKMKILFAGAIEPDYKHDNFTNLFSLIDRFSLFQALEEHYSLDELLIIKTKDDLQKIKGDDYRDMLVMIKSPGDVHWFYWDKWYSLLASVDFFLAFPGVRIPLCHNLVEAMSVGVIPIIQYSDFLADPLEHKVNCIKFNTKNELYRQIDEIMKMDKSEIERLKQGAIIYYDSFLKPQKFIERIVRKNDEGILNGVYLYSEFNSVDKLKVELRTYNR